VGPSFAQSYNFDFEANGVSATGLFNVSGGTITGISGTVSDASVVNFNGSIASILSPGSSINTAGFSNDNSLYYPTPPYLDDHGVSFQLDNQTDLNLYYQTTNDPGYILQGSTGGIGTLSVTQTPAPLPGSGLLSYLALGFAGLFFQRKIIGHKIRSELARWSIEPS
jgi:hypothetical protein